MKTKYEYIHFIQIADTGKTTIWSIGNNRTLGFLGQVRWNSRWRSYCFFPTSDTVFDKSCLLDVVDFINRLTKEERG